MPITEREEKIIRKSFQPKSWNDVKTHDSWSVFRIMSEFVGSMEKMSKIGPCVAILGSARTKPEERYYKMAEEIALKITRLGFGVITGGGPGIMEAANKGAKEAGGDSIGLVIQLPFEAKGNDFIDYDKYITFDYFFVRKTIFMRYAQGYIVMPGGFGTLDEMVEVLTLIQTEKLSDFPIILVGKDYWQGLIDWFHGTLLKEKMVSEEDFELFHVVDTADEAVKIIEEFYHRFSVKPNLEF